MAANLPQKQTMSQLSTKWAALINPVLANPITNGLILQNQALTTGFNAVNHKLGRKLQGWIPIGQNAQANLWDSQAMNQTPQLTLNLNASADVIVSLYVF
jgi:hypothetical protein